MRRGVMNLLFMYSLYVVQKTNRDFLNPVLISLTYDLKDVAELSRTERSGNSLPDMNRFPIVNKEFSATNISVCIFSVVQ